MTTATLTRTEAAAPTEIATPAASLADLRALRAALGAALAEASPATPGWRVAVARAIALVGGTATGDGAPVILLREFAVRARRARGEAPTDLRAAVRETADLLASARSLA